MLKCRKVSAERRDSREMKQILIVEDDKEICEEVKLLLNTSGYEAEYLIDFKNTAEEIIRKNPDLVLLDIQIPYKSGEIVLKELREKSQIPVIMVTSRDTEIDEVLSMSYGADDYITKPYNPTILLLRIHALFRRMEPKTNLTYHEIEVLPQKGVLKKQENEIILTKNEMIIFSYLLSKQGIIVSRNELMTELWNNQEYLNDNALTVNISRLRTKLKEIGYEMAIETRKGQGYILV